MSALPTTAPEARKTSADHEILFQNWFKSVGPRTYAVQVKKASNGNHYIVLTEGKRDDAGQVRKTRVFVYSEDFIEFFKLLHETAVFVRENPVPEDVKKRMEKWWKKDKARAPK